MLKNTLFICLVGLIGLCQSAFAITIINQTDSVRIIEIKEAYRPVSDKPGNLAAPVSLGYAPEKVVIAPHSIETIHLNTAPSILLVTMTNKIKKEDKKIITQEIICYEPYGFQGQKEEYFNDEWGFVIHKPIAEQLSVFHPDYTYKKWAFEKMEERGYGVKCLHPLLLAKITSLEELPDDLKSHHAGEAPISVRKY